MSRRNNDKTAHFDPRIGDEDDAEDPPHIHRQKSSTASPAESGTSSPPRGEKKGEKQRDATKKPPPPPKSGLLDKFTLPQNLQWIPNNWNWSKLKPVIRSAVAQWVGLLLIVINPTLRAMGQAGFLILIAGFLSPPSDPLVANIERELIILFMVTLSWAWTCLAIKLASLARSEILTTPDLSEIFSGAYVEAGPSIIFAVFLFFGTAFFLYVRARQGPGPFIFATVLGCILLDISLLTAALFPYPYYNSGKVVVIPLALHSAIAIVASIVLFPLSISAQYTTALRAVIEPLHTVLKEHIAILNIPTTSPDFKPAAVRAAAGKAEAGLAPLANSARLLKRDIVWHRFSGPDLEAFRERAQRLSVAAHVMNMYFTLIDPTRERFPVTLAPSHPGTPIGTPAASRAASPVRGMSRNDSAPHSPPQTPLDEEPRDVVWKRRSRRRHHPHFEDEPSSPASSRPSSIRTGRHSHRHSLLHLHLHLPAFHHREHVVGVFESQRYLDLESQYFSHPFSAQFTERATELLRESAQELLEECVGGLKTFDGWLETSRRNKLSFWKGNAKKRRIHQERQASVQTAINNIGSALDRFKKDRRLRVLEPYRSAFDSRHLGSLTGDNVPPHRFLFHCYVYQYHLSRFTARLLETLEIAAELERTRTKTRLWFPTMPLYKFWDWNNDDVDDREDDENPDVIQGMEAMEDDLGMPTRRDPDALPPGNLFEKVMNAMYHGARACSGGNVLYALKAGLLTVVLSIPSLLQSTAGFAYAERFNWAIFMGQLTLARFRGDTSFGLTARIISTFSGGVLGAVMWYISTGTGTGNPYGLAVVCAVAFPFFYFARLYWTVPPMTNIIFFVTTVLILGFSWQNTHYRLGTFGYYGINLAWRRFVLVTCGVVAAFIFSFFPPSNTLRGYQRGSLATAVAETGSVYCAIVSYANARHSEDTRQIMQALLAIRSKLKRSIVLRTNIIYEFSLRGRWPAERYQKIVELQLEISSLLSHLLSVTEHLEPSWSRAFLRRTRFLDADFQGDVLAVISLISTALRTGTPLPQITPAPLFERFLMHHHGLNVVRHEADDDYGLPRTMTMDTLENEQYMCFCVGVSTAYGIITRLDRLMMATKELVGEQYHIHGVGFVAKTGGVEMASRTNSLRPAMDV
ncbi:hypothetical protein OF83DRAFT_1057097 [Amylostereum chailletii]|nr:hypothetical protein OF83DRAFT_1057097 [Amylostereum chailletii]